MTKNPDNPLRLILEKIKANAEDGSLRLVGTYSVQHYEALLNTDDHTQKSHFPIIAKALDVPLYSSLVKIGCANELRVLWQQLRDHVALDTLTPEILNNSHIDIKRVIMIGDNYCDGATLTTNAGMTDAEDNIFSALALAKAQPETEAHRAGLILQHQFMSKQPVSEKALSSARWLLMQASYDVSRHLAQTIATMESYAYRQQVLTYNVPKCVMALSNVRPRAEIKFKAAVPTL